MTDDNYLSRAEIQLLSGRLKEIAEWVVEELDNAICRQTAFNAPYGDDASRRSDDVADMFNNTASVVAHDLHDVLRAWVEHVCTRKHFPWPGDQRATGYAKWLDRHLIDLALTEEAPQAMDEICDAWKRAKRAIDRPAPQQFAGRCQSDLPGVRCGGVYVWPGTLEKKCDACGVTCDVQKMQAVLHAEVEGRFYTGPDLATALSISTKTKVPFERVRNWIRRGKLEAATQNPQGKLMYRLSDAKALNERRRKKSA